MQLKVCECTYFFVKAIKILDQKSPTSDQNQKYIESKSPSSTTLLAEIH